jgi:hypothetical protein
VEFGTRDIPLFQLRIQVPIKLDEIMVGVIDKAELTGGRVPDKILVDPEDKVPILLDKLLFVRRFWDL